MKTIFILDDNPVQQKQMNQHFTSMGFAVRSFSTAAEFEAMNDKPYMIILDDRMDNKEKSGLMFLKKVKRKMSGVPVVYMVSRLERKILSDGTKIGAYDVIEKNTAAFVNLRTTLDKLESEPVKQSWFSRLFAKKSAQSMPAFTV